MGGTLLCLFLSPADRVKQRVEGFASCTTRIPHDTQYS